MGDLTNDFSSSEFECNCGCGQVGIKDMLLHRLQKMRDEYGEVVIITSGVRCQDWNRDVGGKSNSAHLTGEAADIDVPDSKQRFALIKAAIFAGFTRIGVGSTFIHVDVDGTKPQDRMWVY